MLGVLIAQLFSIQQAQAHDPVFGFYRVGLPMACSCYGVAIVTALLGAHRFWRQQSAMANSKVHAGGWELKVIGLLTTGVGASLALASCIVLVRTFFLPLTDIDC
jgi:predicted branched-subunit amino acid permease